MVAYQAALPPPDPAWPVEVRVLMAALHVRPFEIGLQIGPMERQCGLCDHNISTRFAACVGMTPKQYQMHHRLELAKRLLRDRRLRQVSITQIAMAVGYSSLGAFSKEFKTWVGSAPSAYRSK